MKKQTKISKEKKHPSISTKTLDTGENKVSPLQTLQKLAKKEFSSIQKKSHKENIRLVKNFISVSYESLRKASEEKTNMLAEFRFKHSKEINAVVLSNPKSISKFIEQVLICKPGGPKEKMIKEQKENKGGFQIDSYKEYTTQLIRELLLEYPNVYISLLDRLKYLYPLFTTYDIVFNVESTNLYTINGIRFGTNPGSLSFTIKDTGMQVNAIIINWRDDAITFHFPQNLSGIPFHSEAFLTVCNTNGYSNSTSVVLEPVCDVYFSSDSSEDSGSKYLAIPPGPDWWYTYEKVISLYSPPLPQEYDFFNSSILTALSLNLNLTTKSYSIPEGIESEASMSLCSDSIYLYNNQMGANVIVTDDWYWDYVLEATFFITVPKGYSCPGWTKSGSGY